MPFAEHFMVQGITTAAQTATLPASININCGFVPTKVEIYNETQWGKPDNAFGNQVIQRINWSYVNPGKTKVERISTANDSLFSFSLTSNGISVYDGEASVLLGPVINGTDITNGNPSQITAAGHGLQTGDQIIITNPATMTQIGGLRFTITVVDADNFTIPLNASLGGLNAASGMQTLIIRKVLVPELYYPAHVSISNISQASSAVISTTVNHGLTVGQKVRIRVPVSQGMVQMNNLQGLITAVTATTLTVNINSSTFTAFTWPGQVAVSGAFSQAAVIPIGAGPSAVITPPFWFQDNLDDATTNIGYQGFTIGTGLLQTATGGTPGIVAGDILSWTAWRADV